MDNEQPSVSNTLVWLNSREVGELPEALRSLYEIYPELFRDTVIPLIISQRLALDNARDLVKTLALRLGER